MINPFEQPKAPEIEIEKSEVQVYVEKNLKEFENVEVKKLSELPYWKKINEFAVRKGIADIDNIETVIANDGEQWEDIFGSNDSKLSHKPKIIILKKEIFDNGEISEENISWLVHEIGHIKFYQNLGNDLDAYMEEYHRKGNYTDSDMEKFAFELQFEYLKTQGKTQEECIGIVKNYLNKSFGEDDEIGDAEKAAKENEYKQIIKFLVKVY